MKIQFAKACGMPWNLYLEGSLQQLENNNDLRFFVCLFLISNYTLGTRKTRNGLNPKQVDDKTQKNVEHF